MTRALRSAVLLALLVAAVPAPAMDRERGPDRTRPDPLSESIREKADKADRARDARREKRKDRREEETLRQENLEQERRDATGNE